MHIIPVSFTLSVSEALDARLDLINIGCVSGIVCLAPTKKNRIGMMRAMMAATHVAKTVLAEGGWSSTNDVLYPTTIPLGYIQLKCVFCCHSFVMR